MNRLLVITLFSLCFQFSTWAGSEKVEISCRKPSVTYGLSIDIRNSFGQGGEMDNRLFVFINGGYQGVPEVSAFSQAFGKGDVTYLNFEEIEGWNHCQFSPTELNCNLRQSSRPMHLIGRRDFEGPQALILQVSDFNLNFRFDPQTKNGHFKFDVTEFGTQVQRVIEYDLPCEIYHSL